MADGTAATGRPGALSRPPCRSPARAPLAAVLSHDHAGPHHGDSSSQLLRLSLRHWLTPQTSLRLTLLKKPQPLGHLVLL